MEGSNSGGSVGPAQDRLRFRSDREDERVHRNVVVTGVRELREMVLEEIIHAGLSGERAIDEFYEIVDRVSPETEKLSFLEPLVSTAMMAEKRGLNSYEKAQVARLQQDVARCIVECVQSGSQAEAIFSDVELFCELCRIMFLGEVADRFKHGITGMVAGWVAFERCGFTVKPGDPLKDDVGRGIDLFVVGRDGFKRAVDMKCWQTDSFVVEEKGGRYLVYVPQPETYPELYDPHGFLPNGKFMEKFREKILPVVIPPRGNFTRTVIRRPLLKGAPART